MSTSLTSTVKSVVFGYSVHPPFSNEKKGSLCEKKQQKAGWKERDKGIRGREEYGRGCPKGECALYVGGGKETFYKRNLRKIFVAKMTFFTLFSC